MTRSCTASKWISASARTTPRGFRKRFERVVDKESIHYSSDCLAQIAYAMERFLWLKREGIFDLDTLVAGLPALPSPLPQCFRDMGFTKIPASVEDVERQYKQLARTAHPDGGGSDEAFKKLTQAKAECLKILEVSHG